MNDIPDLFRVVGLLPPPCPPQKSNDGTPITHQPYLEDVLRVVNCPKQQGRAGDEVIHQLEVRLQQLLHLLEGERVSRPPPWVPRPV